MPTVLRRSLLHRFSPQSRASFPASSLIAFALTAGLLIYYALRGGSYDTVVRQEEALAVWWVLGLGFAFGLLPRKRLSAGCLLAVGVLMLLAIWTAIDLAWTESDELTFAEIARVLHYVGLLLLIWSLVGRDNWLPVAAGVMTAGVVVCGIAVLSRLAPSLFPTDYVTRAFNSPSQPFYRLSYPFNYWNAVGAWSVLSLGMALAWSAHARSLAVRIAGLIGVPVCALAVYLSYSRAGVVGSGLVVLLIFALSRNRWVVAAHAVAAAGGSALAIVITRHHPGIAKATSGAGAGSVAVALVVAAAICAAAVIVTWLAKGDQRWRLPRRPAQWAVAITVVAAIFVAAVPASGRISHGWDQFRNKAQSAETSSSDPASRLTNLGGARYEHWKSAFHAFKAEPVHGTGAGTFEFWWNRHGGVQFVRDAHSLYLEQAAELGAPGAILTLVFVIALAVAALRTRARLTDPAEIGAHAALCGGFLVFLFHAGVDWMWESTAVTVLALTAAGAAASISGAPRIKPVRPAVRMPMVAAAVVIGLVQLPGLVATSRVRDSQRSLRAGAVTSAFAEADDAVGAEPWAASPYVQRALLEENVGELRAARVDLGRAIAREPTNYSHYLLLARVDAEMGQVAQALDAYKQAKRLRPASLFVSPQ